MRNSSAAKLRQVTELMKVLHMRVEARERVTENGFIEKVVFWIDDEQYPQPAPAVVAENLAPVPGSTGAPADNA